MSTKTDVPTAPPVFQLDPAAQLDLILDALGLQHTMADYGRLAAELSRLAGHTPSWTAKYVQAVLKRTLAPSPKFVAAILAMGQVADGTPTGVAGAELVQVLARPGTVPAGVYVPAGVKILKCLKPSCPVWFIRLSPGQRYHDPTCSPSYRPPR